MPKKDANTYNYLFPQVRLVGMIQYFHFYAAKMLQRLLGFFLIFSFLFIFLPYMQ